MLVELPWGPWPLPMLSGLAAVAHNCRMRVVTLPAYVQVFAALMPALALIKVAADFGAAALACWCREWRYWSVGLDGQDKPVCMSLRQYWQRGMALALPVNASLYRRALHVDQFRSRLARASLLYWRS